MRLYLVQHSVSCMRTCDWQHTKGILIRLILVDLPSPAQVVEVYPSLYLSLPSHPSTVCRSCKVLKVLNLKIRPKTINSRHSIRVLQRSPGGPKSSRWGPLGRIFRGESEFEHEKAWKSTIIPQIIYSRISIRVTLCVRCVSVSVFIVYIRPELPRAPEGTPRGVSDMLSSNLSTRTSEKVSEYEF